MRVPLTEGAAEVGSGPGVQIGLRTRLLGPTVGVRLAFGGYVGQAAWQCTSGTLYRIAYSSDVG